MIPLYLRKKLLRLIRKNIYQKEDIHLSKAGYQAVAKIFWNEIK